jgi:hypothetical protein
MGIKKAGVEKVRFQVLTAASIQMVIFWVIAMMPLPW